MVDNSLIVVHFWIINISVQDINQSLIALHAVCYLPSGNQYHNCKFLDLQVHSRVGRPFATLKWLKIPVHDFIVSIEIAIRYIPILTLIAERIAKAQASRGAVWGTSKGNVIEKVKQVIPLILPLFLQSFQKAEKIAMAMDARGYGLIEKRSRYFISRVTIWDVIFVVAQIMLFVSRHCG